MSGRDSLGRPPLTGPEEPSAEVLDELLRAFSVDPEAHDDLAAAIDLTSPEVEALLTPAAAPQPTVPPEGADSGDVTVATAASPEAPPAADDVAAAEDVSSVDVTADGSTADEAPTDDAASAGAGVVGDPFLAGSDPDGGADAPGGDSPRAVISIVDPGDAPDSVYVTGSLEPDTSSRPTVVIEDDGEAAGTTSISIEDATSATKIEPRLRDRRIEVKKAAGRRRLRWALIVVGALALVIAALAVLGSSLFDIDDVQVEGAQHTAPEDLAVVVEQLRGQPVLRADTGRAEEDLEKLPWVEDARVTTDFPHGATIELRERVAAAAFQAEDGRWRLIDDAGRVLAVSDEPPPGYLVITSSDVPNVELGQYGPPGLAGAATLARSLTPTMLARAGEIAVAPDGSDLRLTFTDGTEVRFGAAGELVDKLVRLETKLAELAGEPVRYLDVSTNEVGQG